MGYINNHKWFILVCGSLTGIIPAPFPGIYSICPRDWVYRGLTIALHPRRHIRWGDGRCIYLAVMAVMNYSSFRFWNGCVTAAVSLLKLKGVFRSETATWIQKWFKMSVGTSSSRNLESSRGIIVFQGGGDGRGYRSIYNMPGGSIFDSRFEFAPFFCFSNFYNHARRLRLKKILYLQ